MSLPKSSWGATEVAVVTYGSMNEGYLQEGGDLVGRRIPDGFQHGLRPCGSCIPEAFSQLCEMYSHQLLIAYITNSSRDLMALGTF